MLCTQLRELDLTGNDVTQHCNYRDYVKNNIPEIGLLDGIPYGDDAGNNLQPTSAGGGIFESFSSSDYSASVITTTTASESISSSSNDIIPLEIYIRPASCGNIMQPKIESKLLISRPSTAG